MVKISPLYEQSLKPVTIDPSIDKPYQGVKQSIDRWLSIDRNQSVSMLIMSTYGYHAFSKMYPNIMDTTLASDMACHRLYNCNATRLILENGVDCNNITTLTNLANKLPDTEQYKIQAVKEEMAKQVQQVQLRLLFRPVTPGARFGPIEFYSILCELGYKDHANLLNFGGTWSTIEG